MRSSAVVRLLTLLLAVGVTTLATPPAEAAGQVELSTSALSFGPATPGPSQETKTVDVTNTGDEDVVVGSPSITGPGKAYFWASETCDGGVDGSITLQPGDDCTIEVTFAASTVGARSATLSIPDSAGAALTVALSATTLMPDIDIDAPAPFGPTAVGDSTTRDVTVSSTGEVPLEVGPATITGSDAGQFSVIGNDCALAATAPDDTCTVTVRFLPTSSGGKSATLNIPSNAGAAATVPLNGSIGTPVFTVAPGSINIPSTVVGNTAAASVNVSNTGVGVLDWSDATLSGTNATQFELDDTCESAELIGTEPCAVRVVFRPTSAGTKTATLTLSAAGQPDQTVSVSGVAVAATRIVSTAPASLAFPDQSVTSSSSPLPVTITNTGNSQLIISQETFSIAPATDYTFSYDCPLPLAPGEQCTVNVVFRPTAVGTRNATLSIISNGPTKSVPVSGVGVATNPVTFNPGVRQAGNVAVGASSGTLNHTLAVPAGGTATQIQSLALAGPAANQFSIQSTTCNGVTLLPGGASCAVTLRFTPTSMGLKAAHVAIATNGAPYSIAVNGIATRGFPNPTPTSLDFGASAVDTATSGQTVTVTNTGNAAVTVNAVSITGTDAGDFTITATDCNGTALAKDATCTVNVAFDPTARGARSATLTITPNAGGNQTVSLNGVGLGAVANLDTSSLDYGSQPVGLTSAPLTATITNDGDAGLSIGAASVTGTHAGEFSLTSDTCSGTVVAPGDSCLLTVSVAPTSRGSRSATLTVPHGAGGPAAIDLTATGTQAVASVNPASRNFGTQPVGDPTSSQSFTVSNTGLDPLEVTELGFGGADPGSFGLTGSTCHGASLANNESCTVSVRFNPTSAGSKSATLTFGHNGSGDSAATLTGIGLAPVASPSTTEIDFGQVVMGDTSDPETVTLTNTGTANLVIGTTSVSGPGSDSFDVTDDDCAGATVAPDASCTITVTFTGGDSGTTTASLSTIHNATDSPTVISLTGISTPTSDIKILGIGSAYTGHDHLVTRTVPSSGTLMKYKVGIVNEDSVAHTYKFRLTSSGAAATAQVWATGFPAQVLPTDGSGNFVTGSVLPGKTVLYELRVTPTAPGQVTSSVDVDLLSSTGDLIEGVSTQTNTAAPLNGNSGFELFARQGSQPLIGGPVSGQTVTSPAMNVGQSTTFKLRLKNNSATPKQIGLRLTRTDGCDGSFTVTVKSGTAVITTAAFAGTYLSPSLGTGKYKDIVVSIKRATAGCRAVHLRAESLDNGVTVRTSNLVTNASYNAAID